jgi:predicted transposase YdaD
LELGRQEGWQEGRQEGRQEGERCVVLRLLRKRVGPLDTGIEEQIGRLSPESLEELEETLLDFVCRADLDVWLKKPPRG